MKALLIVAHGSRKQASNDEIIELAKALKAKSTSHFDVVSHAFIQFTTPLLDEQIDALAAQGASHIKIFPYFIAAGSHVVSDIPAVIKKAEERYPDIDFFLCDHLGKTRGIQQLILDEVTKN